MTTGAAVTVTLPARYARDWWMRCGEPEFDLPEPAMKSWRSTVCTMTLTPEALADMVSDIRHYTGREMRGEYVAEGSRGIVLSADATRKRLERAGLWPS